MQQEAFGLAFSYWFRVWLLERNFMEYYGNKRVLGREVRFQNNWETIFFQMSMYNLQSSWFLHFFETILKKIHFIFVWKFLVSSLWQPQVKKVTEDKALRTPDFGHKWLENWTNIWGNHFSGIENKWHNPQEKGNSPSDVRLALCPSSQLCCRRLACGCPFDPKRQGSEFGATQVDGSCILRHWGGGSKKAHKQEFSRILA